MFTGEGNFERGRREAMENRDAIERRARIEAEAASAARNRLEKGSPSAGRRNFADILNTMVADAAAREMPGLAALEGIRKSQRRGGYTSASDHNRAHDKFERAVGGRFDRLHPDSRLRRAAASPTEGSDDARDQRYVTPLVDERVKDAPGSLQGGKRDLWPSGGVEGIQPEFLLDVAQRLIEEVRAQART